jgi:peptidyl-prolyl cis-trans isomerase B (cyclophilin B)
MLALLAAIVLALAGCGDDDEGDLQAPAGSTQAQPEPTPTEQQAQTTPGGCNAVEAPSPRETSKQPKPKQALDASKSWSLVVKTNCGDFTIGLDLESGPNAAASMVALARSGWFDRTIFHRIAPGFVIQGGDPAGDGTGGPGYKTREAPPDDVVYSEGVVAMAKGGNEAAGTAGSQFFVVTAPDAGLPADYAVLGKVVRGMDVVKLIEAQAPPETPQQGGPPADPVVMEKVEITEE